MQMNLKDCGNRHQIHECYLQWGYIEIRVSHSHRITEFSRFPIRFHKDNDRVRNHLQIAGSDEFAIPNIIGSSHPDGETMSGFEFGVSKIYTWKEIRSS